MNNNVQFLYLNKPDFNLISRIIFDILADNMSIIAPTGNTREEDYECWFNSVSDGLKCDERQIILIKHFNNIIGYFQYYINSNTFMMEEIQLKPEYHGKGIFRALYGFIFENIGTNIEFVEAFASIHNSKSIGILEKFGLKNIGLYKNGRSFHFKGNYSNIIKWYKAK